MELAPDKEAPEGSLASDKAVPERSPAPPAMRTHSEEVQAENHQEEPHQKVPQDTLIVDFPAFSTVTCKCVLFCKPPRSEGLAKQFIQVFLKHLIEKSKKNSLASMIFY